MATSLDKKSTIDEIRRRFDNDVERFSHVDTGQEATIDAPLAMELIAKAAIASTDTISSVLDIGCGAGNNTLKLLEFAGSFDCDLVDLSYPMLLRAKERISRVNDGRVRTLQGDFRDVELTENYYDVVLAAAVLHHLREDEDWETVFRKIYRLTATGGTIWITDLVRHENRAVHDMMWQRYAEYLEKLGGKAYQKKVVTYIDKEDSPRPVTYQLDLLRKVGFSEVDILHKNSCFAVFGAKKGRRTESKNLILPFQIKRV